MGACSKKFSSCCCIRRPLELGYEVKDKTIWQDNESVILLEQNGSIITETFFLLVILQINQTIQIFDPLEGISLCGDGCVERSI